MFSRDASCSFSCFYVLYINKQVQSGEQAALIVEKSAVHIGNRESSKSYVAAVLRAARDWFTLQCEHRHLRSRGPQARGYRRGVASGAIDKVYAFRQIG
jgi:hypothetical protein